MAKQSVIAAKEEKKKQIKLRSTGWEEDVAILSSESPGTSLRK